MIKDDSVLNFHKRMSLYESTFVSNIGNPHVLKELESTSNLAKFNKPDDKDEDKASTIGKNDDEESIKEDEGEADQEVMEWLNRFNRLGGNTVAEATGDKKFDSMMDRITSSDTPSSNFGKSTSADNISKKTQDPEILQKCMDLTMDILNAAEETNQAIRKMMGK